MKTAIVTDTNSGMSAAEGKEKGIFILPMPVIIDGKTYKEGVEVTNLEVFKAMHENRDISTSQPDLLSLENIWKEAFAAGYDEIVHIPMSSGLSGSCAMAQQMARNYDGRVQVVDNHRISVTMYESVLDAKAMADEGKSAKEIRETLEEHGLFAKPPSSSGRLPSIAGYRYYVDYLLKPTTVDEKERQTGGEKLVIAGQYPYICRTF